MNGEKIPPVHPGEILLEEGAAQIAQNLNSRHSILLYI
jgi:hypothetical protein